MQENSKLRQNLSQTYKEKMEECETAGVIVKNRSSHQPLSLPQKKEVSSADEPKVIAP